MNRRHQEQAAKGRFHVFSWEDEKLQLIQDIEPFSRTDSVYLAFELAEKLHSSGFFTCVVDSFNHQLLFNIAPYEEAGSVWADRLHLLIN